MFPTTDGAHLRLESELLVLWILVITDNIWANASYNLIINTPKVEKQKGIIVTSCFPQCCETRGEEKTQCRRCRLREHQAELGNSTSHCANFSLASEDIGNHCSSGTTALFIEHNNLLFTTFRKPALYNLLFTTFSKLEFYLGYLCSHENTLMALTQVFKPSYYFVSDICSNIFFVYYCSQEHALLHRETETYCRNSNYRIKYMYFEQNIHWNL